METRAFTKAFSLGRDMGGFGHMKTTIVSGHFEPVSEQIRIGFALHYALYRASSIKGLRAPLVAL